MNILKTYLAIWEFGEEFFGGIGLTKYEIGGQLHFCSRILGCNKHLLCTEVVRVSVQSL